MTQFKLDSFLPYQLATLSARVSKGFSKQYRDRFGISVSEWRVVAHLSQDAAVSVREICDKVGMDKPRVSRAAGRLEAAGYVQKVISAHDRRLIELSLTAKGHAMMDELTPLAHEYQAALMAALGQDQDVFQEWMRAMESAIDL